MTKGRVDEVIAFFEELPRFLRGAILVVVHLSLFGAAYFVAFLFRFDFAIPEAQQAIFWRSLVALLFLKTAVFAAMRGFSGWWRYVSLYDLIGLAYALSLGSLLFFVVNTLMVGGGSEFPRSIYLLDFAMSLLFLGGARGFLRLIREALSSRGVRSSRPRNLLIVGAGDQGDLLVRELSRGDGFRYRPVAFLDESPNKWGLRLHGIKVEGPLSRLPQVVKEKGVEEVVIALDPGEQGRLWEVLELSREVEIQPRILPPMLSLLNKERMLRELPEVSITDLLGREAIELDMEALGQFLADQVVMVTGAGGSIGAELCRQIMNFEPRRLIMVDCAETPLFQIHRELKGQEGAPLSPWIADVSDEARMEAIFLREAPQVVIHAAAYKHVPLMESNPSVAVKNNVVGTQVVADLSGEYGVQTFVLISTDKAVNPTSVMGATKRVTELYLHRTQERFPRSRYCAVRFGNVLGSNGSVVPIFKEQIRQGGPVTVTHEEMTRYFMTIPEAVQLVLQAAAFETDQGLFILDMGEPVRIADLARDMIRLSGMTEEEIPITFTGMRPGEKLYEELTLDEERVARTAHAKIFIGQSPGKPPPGFEPLYQALIQAAARQDDHRVRLFLSHLIPGYQGGEGPGELVDLSRFRAAR